ncbi:small heat shock protein, chloroplastic-like [Ananas comosus]|uniref:Small heat shock protein, chloroplastic-like n=1 Tax=Ananas comosus TaxID=4615 RepID=A0A6P5EJG2_ANACO|nr:small heat shock protein, chloroplastic-like [Ananas comosus]
MATAVAQYSLCPVFALSSKNSARSVVTLPTSSSSSYKVRRHQRRGLVTALAAEEKQESPFLNVEVQDHSGKSSSTAVERRKTPGRRRSAFELAPFGLVDPFSPMKTVRQMLDTVDQLFEDAMTYPGLGSDVRTPWDVMEDDKEVKMRFDVPGLSKEELRVAVEDDNVLVVRGERKEEEGGEAEDAWWKGWKESSYYTRVVLPDNCDVSQVKAALQNGVLLVTVPKKNVERNVIDVQIE